MIQFILYSNQKRFHYDGFFLTFARWQFISIYLHKSFLSHIHSQYIDIHFWNALFLTWNTLYIWHAFLPNEYVCVCVYDHYISIYDCRIELANSWIDTAHFRYPVCRTQTSKFRSHSMWQKCSLRAYNESKTRYVT